MNHLTIEQLEAFLVGEPPADPVEFRRHLAECETCARRLAAAARFEEHLEHAAAGLAGRRTVRARIALAAAAGLVLLAAAGIVIRPRPDRVAAAPPLPVSAAPATAAIAYGMAAPPVAGSPGLEARIPLLCEDCVSPVDLCRYRDDTAWTSGAAQVPAPGSSADGVATP